MNSDGLLPWSKNKITVLVAPKNSIQFNASKSTTGDFRPASLVFVNCVSPLRKIVQKASLVFHITVRFCLVMYGSFPNLKWPFLLLIEMTRWQNESKVAFIFLHRAIFMWCLEISQGKQVFINRKRHGNKETIQFYFVIQLIDSICTKQQSLMKKINHTRALNFLLSLEQYENCLYLLKDATLLDNWFTRRCQESFIFNETKHSKELQTGGNCF